MDRLPSRATRLLHTVRHLRPIQVYARLWLRLYRPRPGRGGLPILRLPVGGWVSMATREPSMIGPGRFRFLNEEGGLGRREDWNAPARDKLWLYNLHYFDDLNADGGEARTAWHRALVARWIAENPPFAGEGWEPYPLSLRIVNWLKWALAGNPLDPAWVESLALQARYLRRRLEYHLLGNHLFANAKALFFAGLCFAGEEAQGWLETALRLFGREVGEQVPADGGHFERSPMYHCIVLEDLLDMLNLVRASRFDGQAGDRGTAGPATWDLAPEPGGRPAPELPAWLGVVAPMRRWLAAMTHPDGDIALFNDAAFGIAPAPAALNVYARHLGLGATERPRAAVTHLAESGFVRLASGPAVALLDVGEIGPDYLPGHAHADTLSFELSLYGRRFVVDSGTSCYGIGDERQRQRGTAAHNTVTVDGADSSEVWGGFRVARRARPLGLEIEHAGNRLRVACAHDGYRRLPGRALHHRTWTLAGNALTIDDRIEGNFRVAVARLHLHPAVRVRMETGGRGGALEREGAPPVAWSANGAASVCIAESRYHPRFGVSEPCRCIEIECGPGVLSTTLSWPG